MRTQSRDTHPQAERVLIDLIRKAPVAKRFGLTCSLTLFSAQLNEQNIRKLHPHLVKEDIAAAFISNHYGKSLAEGFRLALERRKTLLTADLWRTLSSIVEIFERIGIHYYVTGQVAVSLYGMQRAASSIDFVVDISSEDTNILLDHLKALCYFDEDNAREAILRRTSFECIHFEAVLKITILLAGHSAYDQEVFRRIQSHHLAEKNQMVLVASPEDIVLAQLVEYLSGGEIADDKWNDILGVLKVQRPDLDMAYLHHWAPVLHVEKLLEGAISDAGLRE